MTNEITIFYSWQSDLDESTNKRAIRGVLRGVCTSIENKRQNVKLDIDEATRNKSGSPNIPDSIFEKISLADIFLCDITTINNSQDKDPKKVPNPNVLIELGFAIANLGWDRIVLVFNKQFGTFPNDLPFDIDKHRVLDYLIKDGKDKGSFNKFEADLLPAIDLIIEKNPLKPHEKRNVNPEQKKRKNDIDQLQRILNSIHVQSFDEFLIGAPARLLGRIFHFWYLYDEIVCSSLFHVYDEKLRQFIVDIHRDWGTCLSYGNRYESIIGTDNYNFYTRSDDTFTPEQQKDFNDLTKTVESLQVSFKDFLKYIRENYLELDIEESSKKAIDNYIKMKSEFSKLINR